jgi:hypothetical protein
VSRGGAAVTGALVALGAGLLLATFGLAPAARRVPQLILVPTLLALLLQLLRDLGRFGGEGSARTGAWRRYGVPARGLESISVEPPRPAREAAALGLVAGVALSIDLLGLALALPLWLGLVLILRARVRVLVAAATAGLTFVAIDLGLVRTLGTFLPPGRLLGWLGL